MWVNFLHSLCKYNIKVLYKTATKQSKCNALQNALQNCITERNGCGETQCLPVIEGNNRLKEVKQEKINPFVSINTIKINTLTKITICEIYQNKHLQVHLVIYSLVIETQLINEHCGKEFSFHRSNSSLKCTYICFYFSILSNNLEKKGYSHIPECLLMSPLIVINRGYF